MGHIRHHAIIVVGLIDNEFLPERPALATAHQAAVDAGNMAVTPIAPAVMNGYGSFLVGVDGSKEGWSDSDEGDAARDRFITWLRPHDGWLTWAEVVIGDDDSEALVARSAFDDDEPTSGQKQEGRADAV